MHKWFPWRYVLKRLARSQGFLDPLTLYARLQRFAQPAEVSEPVELLRAGAVFHARGLLNSRVLQHNLDWVWPYWVERQFDPADVSFLPRAFSLTHVNLTHRNWTATGLPGREALPIVDPRGLLTPFWDSWSIDAWCFDRNGQALLPSRAKQAQQWQELNEQLQVVTRVEACDMTLETRSCLVEGVNGDTVRFTASATIPAGGWLVLALRPCNPEGVSFVDHLVFDKQHNAWQINERDTATFDQPVDEHHTSRYHEADVYVHLRDRIQSDSCRCHVGLVSAAASFELNEQRMRTVSLEIPVTQAPGKRIITATAAVATEDSEQQENWHSALAQKAILVVPDKRITSLYDAAVQSLVLFTPDDCHAGPFTYKRYWYRDAVFIGHGLLSAGLIDRARHLISRFPERQSRSGYFHSQEGEWDANGEVIWLADRFRQMSSETLTPELWASLRAGADWLERKRLPDYGGQLHEGLLPAGFSAEHLGPNDHYYWDNYWALAGLQSAARLAHAFADEESALRYQQSAQKYAAAIERSLQRLPDTPGMPAIPAAPARRLDAGAIGSVVVSYPLQLCAAQDRRLGGTLNYLLTHCFHRNGFFQDMIHSGVNAYLTLHVAQALLRAGDARYAELVKEVARLASPTGHWPEAVHPHTGGGCMGDGHHAWAAAEWVAMMRSCFVREESGQLILGSGILDEWLQPGETLSFGTTPTLFGLISVTIVPVSDSPVGCQLNWHAQWHRRAPEVHVCIPGHEAVVIRQPEASGMVVTRRVSP